MANKKGRGLLMVYCDVPPTVEDEFNRWYNEEHIPERLSIPGVLNAARYVALQGGPKYLACYELETHEAWHSPEWQQWLNNPTPWSQRMSPSVVATTYIRNLYRLIYPDDVDPQTAQADMAPVMLVGRMSVPPELDSQFNQSYNQERLPECYSTPGYVRGRRFEAAMGNRSTRRCMKWNPKTSPSPRNGTCGPLVKHRSGPTRLGPTWSMSRGRQGSTSSYSPAHRTRWGQGRGLLPG